MPRTVRISPVPIPPPPVAPRAERRYGGLVGVALLVAAVVLGIGHLLLAGHGAHSYDRNPSPPAAVRLTAGATYLVSTVDGPGVLRSADQLSCTFTPTGDRSGQPASFSLAGDSLSPEAADSRATHAVGKFVSPTSGTFTVTCAGGAVGSRPVFVDDADDAATDVAGILLVLAVVAAVPGVGLTSGALYRRFGAPRDV